MLVDKSLEASLEDGDPNLASTSREEMKNIDKMALAVLHLALADNVLREVCEEKTALALWKKLETHYLDKSLSSYFYLMMRLFRMHMQEGTPIKQYIDEFNKAVLDYQNAGNSMDNDHLAILFLCSLLYLYDSIRDQILYGMDSISTDDITSILMSKKLLKKSCLESNVEGEGLVANHGRSKGHGHDAGGSSNSDRRKSKGLSKSCSGKNEICCHYCKELGHINWCCPKLKKKKKKDKENNGRKADDSSSATMAVADNDTRKYGDLLIVSADGSSVGQCSSSVCDMSFKTGWVLDFACSYHMCPHREWSATYEPMNGGLTFYGQQHKVQGGWYWHNQIQLFDGIICTLIDVRHVVGLTKNLISFKALDRKGYKFVTQKYQIKVFRGSLCVMKAITTPDTDDLYLLQGSLLTRIVAVASSSHVDDDTMTTLWHMRLGHMLERGMSELSCRGLLGSRKTCSLQFYEHCVFGKQTCLKFSRSVHMTTCIFDYVHTDLWGPTPVTSVGGGKYLLTFVDDFNSKVWVYILKSKDDTFSCFGQWKAMVEM
jgi:hypothetical protein